VYWPAGAELNDELMRVQYNGFPRATFATKANLDFARSLEEPPIGSDVYRMLDWRLLEK